MKPGKSRKIQEAQRFPKYYSLKSLNNIFDYVFLSFRQQIDLPARMMAEDSNGLSLLSHEKYPLPKDFAEKKSKQKMKHHDKSSLLLPLLKESPTKQQKYC